MAWKMKLNSVQKGMPYIWNLSSSVGTLSRFPNKPEDVELVQRFLIEHHKHFPGTAAPGINKLLNANGQMDTVTAVRMLLMGKDTDPVGKLQEISPARGGEIAYGGITWMIVRLNLSMFTFNKQMWERLPEYCSPALKQQLLTKTMP